MKTQADCFRELARVLDMCECRDVDYMQCIKNTKEEWRESYPPAFTSPTEWNFAIAIVEGKPVFIGDTLYNSNGDRFVVTGLCNAETAFAHTEPTNGDYYAANIATATWNPPKPKTVMVELSIEDISIFLGGSYGASSALMALDRISMVLRDAVRITK